jgi:PPM family protein phosphatase
VTSLRWGSATDTGLVRRNNQDFLLATGLVFAVADGMGGHVGGEVASRVAIDALSGALQREQDTPLSADDLVAAIRQANRSVLERAEADPALRGMGTTLTVATLVVDSGEERLAIANVGDSRAYVFSEGELTQLTEDHSVPEELVRQGQLSPEEVETHPQRHILTRALGIMPEVDADVWEVLPFAGDRVLLCSDGLVREVTDVQIASVLRRLVDPDEAARELVVRARAAGGSDNITVVIVDVVDDGGASLAASRAISADVAGGSVPPPPEAAEENMAQRAPVMFPVVEKKRRRVTLRVALFVLVLLAVIAGACATVVVYARGSYFVTLAPTGNQLVIEQGRPGGLLWFHPTLAARTQVTTDQVLGSRLPDLQKGHAVSSVAAGQQYVANLVQEAAGAAPINPDFTAATTTTLAP